MRLVGRQLAGLPTLFLRQAQAEGLGWCCLGPAGFSLTEGLTLSLSKGEAWPAAKL